MKTETNVMGKSDGITIFPQKRRPFSALPNEISGKIKRTAKSTADKTIKKAFRTKIHPKYNMIIELLKCLLHIILIERKVRILKSDYIFNSAKAKQKIKLNGASLLTGLRIEMISNREFLLEGCNGVLQFNDNYVKLAVKDGNIILYGKNFDISGFEEKNITVRGNIDSVEFLIREKNDD